MIFISYQFFLFFSMAAVEASVVALTIPLSYVAMVSFGFSSQIFCRVFGWIYKPGAGGCEEPMGKKAACTMVPTMQLKPTCVVFEWNRSDNTDSNSQFTKCFLCFWYDIANSNICNMVFAVLFLILECHFWIFTYSTIFLVVMCIHFLFSCTVAKVGKFQRYIRTYNYVHVYIIHNNIASCFSHIYRFISHHIPIFFQHVSFTLYYQATGVSGEPKSTHLPLGGTTPKGYYWWKKSTSW